MRLNIKYIAMGFCARYFV